MIHIDINKESTETLPRQIYYAIRNMILKGALAPEEKLPSSRELAKNLAVARNVVIESYEQLIIEGYAFSQNGSGTYVNRDVQFFQEKSKQDQKWSAGDVVKKNYQVSFRTGIPDLEKIPIRKWTQFYQRAADKMAASDLDYRDSFGDYELRKQLARYLNRVRGTEVSPENLMITNGAAQAFHLLCSLISKEEYAVVENPLSHGILHTLQSNGVQISPVPVDEQGMVTDKLPELQVKLIFTTPSHQFPTGVILPAKRRIELIHYAKKRKAYIVEDDYDSEFRFEGSPIQSMQSLAPEQVIYVGTFSKTLMPALRIGYMVIPNELCETVKHAKYIADIHSSTLEQRTLSEFLADGSYEHHIWKMKKWYLQKRNHLEACLRTVFGEQVTISGAEAGLHFIAEFDNINFCEKLMQRIEENGIEISPVCHHSLSAEDKIYRNALVFGYGNTRFEDMEKGAVLIQKSIQEKENHYV